MHPSDAGAAGRDAASPLERALVTLIAASTSLKPDELGDVVAEAGRHLGGRHTRVLLSELAQRTLRPIGRQGPTEDAIPIDGSSAGTAFTTEAPVRVVDGPRWRLWLPILDSAERIGVLATVVDDAGDAAVRSWSLLANLVGELVVTKSRYGDALLTSRREQAVSLAAELRYGLLPPLTFTAPDVVVSGVVEPAYDIAGDTFDYAIDGDRAHIALFDAMGHGLEASRMANLAVTTYRHGRRRLLDIGAVAGAVDAAIEGAFGDFRFVTGHLATLDLASGVLSALNAGHPPAVVFHPDGTWAELPGGRMLPFGLGGGPAAPVETRLGQGDVVLFHTDGVTEAQSTGGEAFGDDRLRRLVAELLAARVRPAELLRQVALGLRAHQPTPRDDATLLLLGWRLGATALPPASRDL